MVGVVKISGMPKNPPLILSFLLSIFLHLGALALPAFWTGGSQAIFSTSRFLEVNFRSVPVRSKEVVVDAGLIREQEDAVSKADPNNGHVQTGVTGFEKQIGVRRSLEDYLPPSRLHRLPKLLTAIDTKVDFLGHEGVVGDAQIMLLISSSGDVDDVLVVESSLPSYVVDSIVSRFRASRFEPGGVGSMSVRSRIRIRISPPSRDELLGNPMSQKQNAWSGMRR